MLINIRLFWMLSVFLASFGLGHLKGQSLPLPSLKITHIGVEDGLSQGSVYSTLEDSRGFTWSTSYEGLNRFAGHSFKIYSFNSKDGTSLRGSSTVGLVEDGEGNVWTGTEECPNRNFHRAMVTKRPIQKTIQ